eukprot:EG_transcript_15298
MALPTSFLLHLICESDLDFCAIHKPSGRTVKLLTGHWIHIAPTSQMPAHNRRSFPSPRDFLRAPARRWTGREGPRPTSPPSSPASLPCAALRRSRPTLRLAAWVGGGVVLVKHLQRQIPTHPDKSRQPCLGLL